MANRELALYTESNTTYDLAEFPQPSNPTLENTFVREEARAVTMALLAIMPPLISGESGGTSARSMARSKRPQADAVPGQVPPSGLVLGDDRRRAPDGAATNSTRVTPSGNTVYSCSYTIVGVQIPDGGCEKGLMRKQDGVRGR